LQISLSPCPSTVLCFPLCASRASAFNPPYFCGGNLQVHAFVTAAFSPESLSAFFSRFSLPFPLTPLESALTENLPLTPLESALPK
jgi:hypothetical protein